MSGGQQHQRHVRPTSYAKTMLAPQLGLLLCERTHVTANGTEIERTCHKSAHAGEPEVEDHHRNELSKTNTSLETGRVTITLIRVALAGKDQESTKGSRKRSLSSARGLDDRNLVTGRESETIAMQTEMKLPRVGVIG